MADELDRDSDWVREVVRAARADVGGRGDGGELDQVKQLAADHGYRARLRDDVLVLYPEDWLDGDGVLRGDVDTDEALEIPLGDSGGAEEARARNDDLLDGFEEEEVDDEDVRFNVERFAEYCENHHGVAVDEVTSRQVEEFVDEYYGRNVWASAEQQEKLERSLEALGRYVDAEEIYSDVDASSEGGG